MKRYWTELSQVAVWVVAIVAPLMWAPPQLGPDALQRDTWLPIAQFLVAFFFAIGWAFLREKKSAKFFGFTAVTLLTCGLISLVQYFRISLVWSCEYASRSRVVIGEQLSGAAAAYAERIGTSDCGRLIEDFGGRTFEIWSREQLIERYIWLGAWYSLNIVLLALALSMVLEALKRTRG